MTDAVSLRIVQKIAEVPRERWDALVDGATPFMKWDWLDSLEQSSSSIMNGPKRRIGREFNIIRKC